MKDAPLDNISEQDRYRLLIESVTDYAIYMLDPTGRIASWNPGAQRFKGYTANEIIGKNFSQFYSAADQTKGLPANALRTARNEGRFEGEGWRYRKDGTRFWAYVILDAILDPSGSLLGFAKVTRDLTEKKLSEQRLKESEERFRLLIQGVTDYAIYMLDRGGRVTNWNAGAQKIKGYKEDEIVGQHFSRFYRDEEREAGEPERALQTAATEGKYEKEGWRVRKDGTPFWAHVIIDPIRNDMGDIIGYAKVTRDITERRNTQMALEQAREQLVQSQKMEAVGQLTGGLAHDFNNLLTGISGSLDMLQLRITQGRFNEIDRYVHAAQGAARRAASLTHRLLAFSRRQTLDPKATDINRLIAGMEDLVSRTVGPTIELEVVGAAGVWTTLVDPHQMENVLLNLCINARDSMPDGGRLTIETANKWLDYDATRQRDIPAGQYLSLCVTDTGSGMTPEIISRAFEPFFTTKPLGEGTGLGLSMVYGFARQSGGETRIYSEIGKGTTVCIYLPRFIGEAQAAESSDEHTPVPRSENTETVLVVDDEATIRMLIVESLHDLGYNPVEAGDGKGGLEILRSNRKIDLLITDVGLPGGMNGRQLADAARVTRPDLKVLFITGYAENAALGNGTLDPGMRVLTKPFAIDTLARQIQGMIEEKGR